jgi:hypothetical protein
MPDRKSNKPNKKQPVVKKATGCLLFIPAELH